MQVKKFRGREIGELMELVKETFGSEAVILSTTELPGKTYEICASGAMTPEELPLEISSSPIIMLDQVVSSEPPLAFRGQKAIEGIFASQGLDATLTQMLIANIDSNMAACGTSAGKLIGESLKKIVKFDAVLPGQAKVVALVGAPGVGKTTTIAKLAARMREAFGLKIGLIAADSFRIGAGFHLQTYASLMQLPFLLLDPQKPMQEELQRAIKAFEKLDLVFIDTPGCSVRERERTSHLGQILSSFQSMEKILVLPAPSNDIDLFAAAKAFKSTSYSRVVLSKVDESAYIGPSLNTAMKLGTALAFFTTGQRVPEDIEPASAQRLGWMLTRTIH